MRSKLFVSRNQPLCGQPQNGQSANFFFFMENEAKRWVPNMTSPHAGGVVEIENTTGRGSVVRIKPREDDNKFYFASDATPLSRVVPTFWSVEMSAPDDAKDFSMVLVVGLRCTSVDGRGRLFENDLYWTSSIAGVIFRNGKHYIEPELPRFISKDVLCLHHDPVRSELHLRSSRLPNRHFSVALNTNDESRRVMVALCKRGRCTIRSEDAWQ